MHLFGVCVDVPYQDSQMILSVNMTSKEFVFVFVQATLQGLKVRSDVHVVFRPFFKIGPLFWLYSFSSFSKCWSAAKKWTSDRFCSPVKIIARAHADSATPAQASLENQESSIQRYKISIRCNAYRDVGPSCTPYSRDAPVKTIGNARLAIPGRTQTECVSDRNKTPSMQKQINNDRII